METYQKLKILLSEEDKDLFFDQLTTEIGKSKWKIRHDLIKNYKKNSFTNSKNILCAESEKYNFNNKIIQGLLWLWDYNGIYEVFNILPLETGSLGYKEYNFILNEFNNLFILNIVDKYEANVILTKPEKLIIDTIGDEAFQSLKSFSNYANKSTGHSHHYDFERWCEFVFIIFRKNIELGSSELEVWLIENGWSEEMASKLASDFEYSISFLKKYEQH